MSKIKVSVVSYLNSKPFIYGLQHSEISKEIDLQLDIPSVCAQKLINHEVEIGLIPVATIPQVNNHHIISNYCIGAQGKVASVMLYSKVPLDKIKTILLDYQSRTSVKLVQVLAKQYWNINPQWVQATENFDTQIEADTAAVIIGDRTFGLENKYPYTYDLAYEWNQFTQLPFVFACWVSNTPLPPNFIEQFNAALKFGLDNRPILINELKNTNRYFTDIDFYLNQNIKYDFGESQKKALNKFLNYTKTL